MSHTLALFDGTLSTRPGLFVTIDGPNGSGKTSLARAVEAVLTGRGDPVYSTAQPSGSALGKLARAAEPEVRGRALACLVAADRHHQLTEHILPALRRGDVVLCDRYVESSLVLQRLDGVGVDYILGVNSGIVRPDIRIRLLADEGVLRARLAERAPGRDRRFERAPDGPRRELALYAEADELLTAAYDVAAEVYDTTSTRAPELGQRVADRIHDRFAARE